MFEKYIAKMNCCVLLDTGSNRSLRLLLNHRLTWNIFFQIQLEKQTKVWACLLLDWFWPECSPFKILQGLTLRNLFSPLCSASCPCTCSTFPTSLLLLLFPSLSSWLHSPSLPFCPSQHFPCCAFLHSVSTSLASLVHSALLPSPSSSSFFVLLSLTSNSSYLISCPFSNPSPLSLVLPALLREASGILLQGPGCSVMTPLLHIAPWHRSHTMTYRAIQS